MQCRYRNTVSRFGIIIGIPCLNQRILRVHNFQSRGFAGLITKVDQAQTFRSQIGSAPERIHRHSRGQCLVVIQIEVGHLLQLRLRELDLSLLLAIFRLTHFTAALPPIEDRQIESRIDVIAQVRQYTGFRKRGNRAVECKGVGFNTVVSVNSDRRKHRVARDVNVLSCRSKRFLRDTQVRILAGSHRLNVIKGRKRLSRIQIINDREIFVQIREQQNGEVQPALAHRQRRFLQTQLLLLGLDLRFDHIAAGNLSGLLLLFCELNKPLRLLKRLLSRRVFALGRD